MQGVTEKIGASRVQPGEPLEHLRRGIVVITEEKNHAASMAGYL